MREPIEPRGELDETEEGDAQHVRFVGWGFAPWWTGPQSGRL